MLLETIRQTMVEIVKELHDKEFVTQKDIAERMGCSPGQLTGLLKPLKDPNRRGLNDRWIERFCVAAGITPGALIKRAFGNIIAFNTVPPPDNGEAAVQYYSPEEKPVVDDLLKILRTDPGGGGKAVRENIEQFKALADFRVGPEPTKKESATRKRRRAS